MELKGTPKLKFDFKKITLKGFLLIPVTVGRMIKVSINLSTQRKKWLQDCEKALVEFSVKSFRVNDKKFYNANSDEEVFTFLKKKLKNFMMNI